jgi:hypothetical protein
MVDRYSGPRMKLRLWSQTPTTNERRGAWTGGQEERMMTEDLEPGPMWGHSSATSSGSLQWGGVVARHLCTTASRSGGGGRLRRTGEQHRCLGPEPGQDGALLIDGRAVGWMVALGRRVLCRRPHTHVRDST